MCVHKYNVCACVRVSVIANTSHDAVCVCFICQWWWATSGSILKMQQRLWTHKSHPPIHPPNKQNTACFDRKQLILSAVRCAAAVVLMSKILSEVDNAILNNLPANCWPASHAKQVMFEHPASAYSLYLFRIPRALPDFGKTAFSCSFDVFENNICVTQRTQHGLPIS